MIRGAIFDADGTLFDSMGLWQNVGSNYLLSIGITPEEDLRAKIESLTFKQVAKYFKESYGVEKNEQEIIGGINKMIEDYYLKEASLKPGVSDFLHALSGKGVKMCIATATDKQHIVTALKRCEVYKYFSDIICCSDIGKGKTSPDIYREALIRLGTDKKKTVVFEDAVYAVKTAVADGFVTVGIYDKYESDEERLKELVDFYIADYDEITNFWGFASAL